VSLGTQDIETGHVSQCPIFVPQGLLVLHSRDHLEADIQILGGSAPPSSKYYEELGIAFPISHHSHAEKEGHKRQFGRRANH
jgi:hypothetical protein